MARKPTTMALAGALPWLMTGLMGLTGLAMAQPQLPPPEATDPVALGLMQGFPPPAGKRVQLAGVLKYPNARWAYHHLRELGPTAAIERAETAAALPQALRDLDAIAVPQVAGPGHKPADLTLLQWQQ